MKKNDPPMAIVLVSLIRLAWLIWKDSRYYRREGAVLDIIGRSAVRQGRYLAAKSIYKEKPDMRHDWMREACGKPMDEVFKR